MSHVITSQVSVPELAERHRLDEAQIVEWIETGALQGDQQKVNRSVVIHGWSAREGEPQDVWFVPVTELPVFRALVQGKSPTEARAELAEIEQRVRTRECSRCGGAGFIEHAHGRSLCPRCLLGPEIGTCARCGTDDVPLSRPGTIRPDAVCPTCIADTQAELLKGGPR